VVAGEMVWVAGGLLYEARLQTETYDDASTDHCSSFPEFCCLTASKRFVMLGMMLAVVICMTLVLDMSNIGALNKETKLCVCEYITVGSR
jgi:hypothetical protein